MIRNIGIFLAIFFLCSAHAHASSISDEVSDSGLAYSLVKMPDNPRVSVQIAWPSHWAFDEKLNQAVPYIGAQLLLSGGAGDYSAGEALERFEGMNSEGHLMPTTDYLFGTLNFSPEHQDEMLKIVNAHLRNPALDERWLERARGQFASHIKEIRLNADTKGFEAMRWAVFGEQPIRTAISLDEPNMIEEVTQDEVATWAKSAFNRNGVSIVVAGDLDTEMANTIVDALFKDIPEGEQLSEVAVATDFSPKRILMHVPDAKASTLTFIGKLPPSREGSELEDILLATSLGNGPQSVLFEAVSTKLQARYGYGAGIVSFTRDTRLLVLSGPMEASKINEAEQVIRQAYTEFRADGPSGDLQQLKQPLKENLTVSQEDASSMSYAVLMAKLDERDIAKGFSLQEELEAVSEKSLKQRLTSSFPTADDFIVVVSSPDASVLKDACVITEQRQAMNCK
ncbi:M16 family metallopeptidase [Granulosicoccus antarcticus]|uniref:Peptidase M16 C-terminal domain-containing protein n=1 Tax=Granulosicoccus antarcticus IMCC3135 TaxID=1192854 RepID=A0A2Z2NXZ4_9GAMM|nr:insulinase family protein [Granulosicoccus antarcticus]ASJ76316.1 hypothetical protein IMCC3135_31340 [Granulosicoccus antarcticus IMCC3135]